ncbi:MAG: hypothetical protein K2Q25_03995 [Mycobacteriaceae bacterium]|nr:hypothetical protein [Mycobacteriaceae bacterium]
MFNSRTVLVLGTAAISAGMVFAVAACQPEAWSAPAPNTSGMYGDPAASAVFWQPQSLKDDCALLAVADVVGELTGREPTEQEMITLAKGTPSEIRPGPIYVPPSEPGDPNQPKGGTGVEMVDETVLLKQYGITSEVIDQVHPDATGLNGLAAIQNYLAAHRHIIAWLNSATIWNSTAQRARADHFVVVTGLDTINQLVHLNDSALDHPDEQVSIATFSKAWQTGKNAILVTLGTT